MNKRNKSPHILNTSSNLLGLCFIVLTSIKVFKLTSESILDEITALAIILFMASSLLSFLSLRSLNEQRSLRYETAADYIFLAGLITMFLCTLLIIFDFIH